MRKENIISVATYIAKTGDTVRHTAELFGLSKSTIHKKMTEDLKHIDLRLYYKVKKVLDKNKAERHMRGGLATRERFRKLKEN